MHAYYGNPIWSHPTLFDYIWSELKYIHLLVSLQTAWVKDTSLLMTGVYAGTTNVW